MELIQKCWLLVTFTLVVGEMVTAQSVSQSPVQVEDHKSAATVTNQKEKDVMSYIETSEFRRNIPLNNVVLTKTSAQKHTGITKKEIPTFKKEISTFKKESKMKNSFVQVPGKKLFKQFQDTKSMASAEKKEDKHDIVVLDPPPAPYQLPFNDEIFLSFRALPSNEEYDRNSRFQHSFFYGYDRL
ncbi:hypothetical protein L9F63_019392 [Diploptera punctata]|uniref:Uncharacterized protein n=1 Tax=Diploptera punctata TaxID=6984 RepID=A0AAD7ZUP8_DIPPU|nr:hypothetical protein L9F63_019392 [Diploptera punctata]